MKLLKVKGWVWKNKKSWQFIKDNGPAHQFRKLCSIKLYPANLVIRIK